MNKPAVFVFLFLFLFLSPVTKEVNGQPLTYSIKKTRFSTGKYDEFSPVFYRNGIVFCTNRNPNLLLNYSSTQDKGLLKIYFADTTSRGVHDPTLFSKALTTNFNDGPATFSSDGDTIYFSRNQTIEGKFRDVTGQKNKLGIFSSVLADGKWTKVRELRINNEWYNVTTPYLSPDGKKLYFASDKPGGYGASDLYYCEWKNDYWNDPVNLGPVINTPGNESYPFVNNAGELFFASDGHPGLGGKDIFFSRLKNGNWLAPIRLDPPINSEFDDFGIVTDPMGGSGYFSSNREKTIDIYRFVTNFPQIFYNDIQEENKYCFSFKDSSTTSIDTLNLKYRWDFGDGKHSSGLSATHCFAGEGEFKIKLDIVDKTSGKLFFAKASYILDLRNLEQPFITSKDILIKGESTVFDGLKSHLPGYEILNYSWNFGDGTRLRGEKVYHAFTEKGEYLVNLELTLKSKSMGGIHKTGISKRVSVLNSLNEKPKNPVLNSSSESEFQDIKKYGNARITSLYSAESVLKMDAIFQVELISSKAKIGLNSNTFRNVPNKYTVKEIIDPEDSSYHYIIDQQLTLMACYPAFKEMEREGFKNVQIRLSLIKDPAEKELYNILKIFGDQADSFFDNSNKLMPTSVILLDQIVRILNKYPAIQLEIDVYSGNSGQLTGNQISTQEKAQLIENFLASRGINPIRLLAKGINEGLHLEPESPGKIRKSNQMVVFTVVSAK